MDDSDIDESVEEVFITEEIPSDENNNDDDDTEDIIDDDDADDDPDGDEDEADGDMSDDNDIEIVVDEKVSDFDWSNFSVEKRKTLEEAEARFRQVKEKRVQNYCPMNFTSLVGKVAEYIGRGGTMLIYVDPSVFATNEWTIESFAFVCVLCRVAPFATFISNTHERLQVTDENLITVAIIVASKAYRYKYLNSIGLQKNFPEFLHACTLNCTQVVNFKAIVSEIDRFKKKLTLSQS